MRCALNWLNYHHLYYFWTVARLGSMSKAAEDLKLARPTVSAQIAQLEDQLGGKLFDRVGRGLALTRFGQDIFAHADEIFDAGQRLKDFVSERPQERTVHLTIGISDVLPKHMAHKLLAPLLLKHDNLKLTCAEGDAEHLVGELALHNVDAILSDVPVGSQVDVRVFHHKLGECGLSFFASPKLGVFDPDKFPQILDGMPILLPSRRTALRRSINLWMEETGVRPKVVAEFDDSALMKVFGQNGLGVFVAPSIIEDDVIQKYDTKLLGRVASIRDTFYLISTKKRLSNEMIRELVQSAKEFLFGHTSEKSP